MPIIKGGKPAVALRYVDADGVEHQVVQARLGERLVWDGTTPALLTMPRATGSGFVRPALVSAGQVQEMPLSDHSAGEAYPAAVSAGAYLAMPCATGVGDVRPPSLVAGVEAEMPTATGAGQAYPATAGEASPGSFYMPTATGVGQAHPAVAAVPFERVMPHVSGVGEVKPAVAYGEAAPLSAVAVGSGVANAAVAQFGQAQLMPRATGTGSVAAASVSAEAAIAMPRATGTGQVNPAVIQTFVPMGAYMTEMYDGWSNDTWNHIVPLLALPAYPGTVLADSGGQKYGIVTSAGNGTVTAQVTYGTSYPTGQQIRIKRNGTIVATGALVSTAIATATWTGAMAVGDIITIEFYGDRRSSGGRWIDFGATKTYFTINPA